MDQKVGGFAYCELVHIVLVLALWGPQWPGTKVCCWYDNSAASVRDPKAVQNALTRPHHCGSMIEEANQQQKVLFFA